ncbi:ERVV1 protein, partial [Asarcornis scutulata]|nr:ERVV1 protein [Asarcornis scutulata]
LAKEGGLCTLINQTCCVYVNKQNQIETDLEKTWENNKILHAVAQDDTSWGFTDLVEKLTAWLPNLTWLKQLFITILMVVVLSMVLCGVIRCILWCFKSTGNSYREWKKNQLRWKLESNRYFERV